MKETDKFFATGLGKAPGLQRERWHPSACIGSRREVTLLFELQHELIRWRTEQGERGGLVLEIEGRFFLGRGSNLSARFRGVRNYAMF